MSADAIFASCVPPLAPADLQCSSRSDDGQVYDNMRTNFTSGTGGPNVLRAFVDEAAGDWMTLSTIQIGRSEQLRSNLSVGDQKRVLNSSAISYPILAALSKPLFFSL